MLSLLAQNEVDAGGAIGAALIIILVSLVIAIVIWIWVFRDAKKRQQQYGAGPWNLTPGIWLVIVIFTSWIGLILYLVARSQQAKGGPGTAYPQQPPAAR